MACFANILTALVALLQFFFMYLEMFLWAPPKGMKIFGLTEEAALSSQVLAANQGFYNGVIAAGLAVSLFLPCFWPLEKEAGAIRIFCLAFVAVAGIYGAATVSSRILYVQALPAVVALVAFLFTRI